MSLLIREFDGPSEAHPVKHRVVSCSAWISDTARLVESVLGHLVHHRRGRVGLLIIAILLLVAWGGQLLAPGSASRQDLYRTLEGPSIAHWLGTDQLGRDMLKRLAVALQTTWGIAIASCAFASVLGVAVGLLAGYTSGLPERVVLRFIDVILSIPPFVLALVIATAMGAGASAVFIALVVRAFPSFVRVTHSSTRQVMGQEYILGAIAVGVPRARILFRHVLPNILPPIIVLWPILLGVGVLISASLSFFRLGVQPPASELGLLIDEGRRYMNLSAALLWLPGILLTISAIALSLLSDGLRSILDPISRQRNLEM